MFKNMLKESDMKIAYGQRKDGTSVQIRRLETKKRKKRRKN